MAAKRLPMRYLREILRLHHDLGLSQRAIAQACGIGLGTVSESLARATRAGIAWPLPDELDDDALGRRLLPAPAGESARVVPDLAGVHAELKRPGVTLSLLWLEYLEAHPGGYRYTQFCEYYRRYARKLSPVMRQVHKAGEKTFVDFSGQRPSIVDRHTGELIEVELFVGVLGASSYVYAEAVPSQELEHWVGAHARMFEFFGGVTEILVPDCLKSAVTLADRYEPGLNRTFADMAAHYGIAIIPARPYRARDKAKVEVSVQVAQRWILACLRNRTFFSIAEMNAAIREKLELLNNRPMKTYGASRRELFERLDRPLLRPLPRHRFEIAAWKPCRVNIDYHVEYDHNVYSVPYTLVGESIEIRATATTIEVLFKSRRVASHARLFGRGQYATLPEHMPKSHRAHALWSPSRLIAWAEKTGPATGRIVTEIMRSRPHPEQGYRSCLGIIRLSDRHGADRVEAASVRAERLGAASYKTIKNILSAGLEALPVEDGEPVCALPLHENVRGADYYRKES